MSGKRPGSESGEPGGGGGGSKKTRNTISLKTKLDVLNRFKAGERAVDIGRELGLPPTTVRTIRKNTQKIRARARSASAPKARRSRGCHMETMERLLTVWIEDQNQCNLPVCMKLIQEKAKSLYLELTRGEGGGSWPEGFGASRGWFRRFRRRSNLHDISVAGEADGRFPAYLRKVIGEGGYSPKQVFNVNQTGLYWKRLPFRTPGPRDAQAAKDHLTLLLGGNAAGDYKFKPLLVYHSETPRALEGYSKEHLRVIWRSNRRAWITVTLFQEWFTLYAVPALREYCAKEKLDFKVLLVLGSAPGHPVNLDDLSENVTVVFMSPDTPSLLQPMDQGAIATFKACYLRRTFSQLVGELDGEGKPTIRECWCEYNILQAIDHIADSWAEVTSDCMNGVWRKVWPECVKDFGGFVDMVPKVLREIVSLAKEVGFDEVEEAGVVELLASHEEELSNEDLLQLEEQRAEEEEDRAALETPPSRLLTVERLAKAFRLLGEAMAVFGEDDPNRERSSKVNRVIADAIGCYKELYQEKKKQAVQQSSGNSAGKANRPFFGVPSLPKKSGTVRVKLDPSI